MELSKIKDYAQKVHIDSTMMYGPSYLLALKRERLATDARKVMEISNDGAVRDAIGYWLENMNDREACKYAGQQMIHVVKTTMKRLQDQNPGDPYLPDYDRLANQSNLIMTVPDNVMAEATLSVNVATEIRRALFSNDVKEVAERCDCEPIKTAAENWLAVWDDEEGSRMAGVLLLKVLKETVEARQKNNEDDPFMADYLRLLTHRDLFIKHTLSDGEEFTRAMNLTTELRRTLLKEDLRRVTEATTCSHVKAAGEGMLAAWDDEQASAKAGATLIGELRAGLKYHLTHNDGHEFNADYIRLLKSRSLYIKKPIREGEELTRAMNLATDLRRDVLKADLTEVANHTADTKVSEAAHALLAVWEDEPATAAPAAELVAVLKEAVKEHAEKKDNDLYGADYNRLLRNYREIFAKKTIRQGEENARAMKLSFGMRRDAFKAQLREAMKHTCSESLRAEGEKWLAECDDASKVAARGLKLIASLKQADCPDCERMASECDLILLPAQPVYSENLSFVEHRAALVADAAKLAEGCPCEQTREALNAWVEVVDGEGRSRKAGGALTAALRGAIFALAEKAGKADEAAAYARLLSLKALFSKKPEADYMRDLAQLMEHCLFAMDCLYVMDITTSEQVKSILGAWLKSFNLPESAEAAKALKHDLLACLSELAASKAEDAWIADCRRLKRCLGFSARMSYGDFFPMEGDLSVTVRFRRALIAADTRDVAMRTGCDGIKHGAEEYLKTWNDPVSSLAAAEKWMNTLKACVTYHYESRDGHPFNADYERLMSYRDMLAKRTPFGYQLLLGERLQRGLNAMDGVEICAATSCHNVQGGIESWMHSWQGENAYNAGFFMKDRMTTGAKYHYMNQDGHPFLPDYERFLKQRRRKWYAWHPDNWDQGEIGYGLDGVLSFRRALLAADVRNVAKRTTCGNVKKASAAYLRAWDDPEASVEAGNFLYATLVDGLQYHYMIKDGHPFNADYERLLAYRDLFALKTQQETLRQFGQVLDSLITGVRKLSGKTAASMSNDQLAYYMNLDNVVADTSRDELSDTLYYRRAVMTADYTNTASLTSCEAIKKSCAAYVKRWNEAEYSKETADALTHELFGCCMYHYMNLDAHPYVEDYERMYTLRDLFANMTTEQWMAATAQTLNRGLLALDILRVKNVCGCGHIAEGVEEWLRNWEDTDITAQVKEHMEKFITESMSYHVERQDGHAYVPDYARFLARKSLYAAKPVTELDVSDADQLYYDYMRALLAADVWSIARRTTCGSTKKGAADYLACYLEPETSPAGSSALLGALQAGARWHYMCLDGHEYNGDYERLMKRAVYCDCLGDVKTFYARMGEEIDSLKA